MQHDQVLIKPIYHYNVKTFTNFNSIFFYHLLYLLEYHCKTKFNQSHFQVEAPKVEEAPKKPAPAPKKMPTAAAPAPSADELDTGMKKATEGTEKDKVGQNDDS